MLERFSRPTTANAVLFMTITALCWSGNFVVGRWAAGHIPPMTLALARWGIASMIMLALAWSRLPADWPQIKARMPLIVLLGMTGAGLFNALQYLGLVYTTATNGGIINSTSPVMIALVGVVLFQDRLAWRQVAGIAISLLGVLTVIGKGDVQALAGLAVNRGDLILLVAMVLGAIYASFIRFKPKVHALSFAAATFLVAAAVNVPLAAAELALGARIDWSPPALLSILYVAIVPSVVAMLCFNRGLEILGGTRAGVFMHLIPLFTAVLAILFLGERPQLYHVAGFGLILGGIWMTARAP